MGGSVKWPRPTSAVLSSVKTCTVPIDCTKQMCGVPLQLTAARLETECNEALLKPKHDI